MAMYKAQVLMKDGTNNIDFIYVSSPDATSMKRTALTKARRVAAQKVIDKFKKKGVKVSVTQIACVG